MTGHPLDDHLPGEEARTHFRGKTLTLTTHRVVYKGRGRRRHEMLSIRITDIIGTTMRGRPWIHPHLLGVPLGIFVLGFMMAVAVEDEAPFVLGIFGAIATLPIPFLVRGRVLRIAAPGTVIEVPAPRRFAHEAATFVQAVEAARMGAATPPDPLRPGA